MTPEVVEDDDTFFVTVNDVGDEIQISFTRNGGIFIEIDEPWAGSTETGFGARTSVTLPPDCAARFIAWINRAAGSINQR